MTTTPVRWLPRFGLRSLLVVVLLAAVLLAWYADHRRQAEALRLAQVDIEIYARQNEQLRSQVNGSLVHPRTFHFWGSADAFIQALTQVEDEGDFHKYASSLASSDEAVLEEVVPKLVALLADPTERSRSRALKTLRLLRKPESPLDLQTDPNRVLKRHADAICRGLVPLLDNRKEFGVDAYLTLRAYGPDARAVLEVLRVKMADDSNYFAAWAAEAVHAIDPETDIGPRLIELVEMNHPDWDFAAWQLAKNAPPAEARRVLIALYDRLENDVDRQAVINSLNSIPVSK